MANEMSKEQVEIIRKLVNDENIIAVYCVGTAMPLVECDDETCNDQVYVVESEDVLKEFAKPYVDKKMPLRGIIFPKAERLKYFNTLVYMNVDDIVYVATDGNRVRVDVSKIVKKQDFSNRPKEQRPVENPQLQLAGTYFMQEATRLVPLEEKTNLKELEEELSANITKGLYILPIEFLEGDEPEIEKIKANKFRIPLIKLKNEDLLQPIFTDNMELMKYNKDGKFRMLVVPFANLERMLVKDAKAYMLNPNGFHMTMPLELIQALKTRFGVGDPKPVK